MWYLQKHEINRYLRRGRCEEITTSIARFFRCNFGDGRPPSITRVGTVM